MEKSIEYTYFKLPLSTKHFLSQGNFDACMQSLPGPLPWMGPGSRLAGSIFCDFTVHLGIVLHDWYISKFCRNFFNPCLSCPNCPCMKFELTGNLVIVHDRTVMDTVKETHFINCTLSRQDRIQHSHLYIAILMQILLHVRSIRLHYYNFVNKHA